MPTARWRPRWATRSSRSPRGCGRASPAPCRRHRDQEPPPMPHASCATRRPAPGPLDATAPAAPFAARPWRPCPRRGACSGGVLATLAVGAAAVAAVLGHEPGRGRRPGGAPARRHRGDGPHCGRGRTGHTGPQGGQPGDVEPRRQLAQFVVLPEGQGYLVESTLPALSSTETYQLWGVVNGQTISLGLLGEIPRLGDVHAGRFAGESRLGITAEPAGGSILPSQAMLASGRV